MLFILVSFFCSPFPGDHYQVPYAQPMTSVTVSDSHLESASAKGGDDDVGIVTKNLMELN
jgi:hypothetical protein